MFARSAKLNDSIPDHPNAMLVAERYESCPRQMMNKMRADLLAGRRRPSPPSSRSKVLISRSPVKSTAVCRP